MIAEGDYLNGLVCTFDTNIYGNGPIVVGQEGLATES